MCVCVCVCVCVCACVRACVRVYVRARERASKHVCVLGKGRGRECVRAFKTKKRRYAVKPTYWQPDKKRRSYHIAPRLDRTVQDHSP